MVAASFVVFAIACLMAFIFFPVGFILWIVSVVMFFVGIGQRKTVQNIYVQQPLPPQVPNPPFEREGRWFTYMNGVLMVWDQSVSQWQVSPPQPWASMAANQPPPQLPPSG
jgi:hypothetical protein